MDDPKAAGGPQKENEPSSELGRSPIDAGEPESAESSGGSLLDHVDMEAALTEALVGTGAEAADGQDGASPPLSEASDEGSRRPPERPLDPPKLVRLANLAREVLEEVRQMDPQDSTVQDLAGLYRRVEDQLMEALPESLASELDAMDLDLPFEDGANHQEVRIAYSGLVGWLGGLFQGLHASLLAAAPILELGPEARVAGQMPPGASPGARPGLQGPGPSSAEQRKGEGYL